MNINSFACKADRQIVEQEEKNTQIYKNFEEKLVEIADTERKYKFGPILSKFSAGEMRTAWHLQSGLKVSIMVI